MVIVKLHGGMANQMFPYAAARRLAHVLNAKLKLDISGFSVYRDRPDLAFRQYALGVFNIDQEFASQSEIEQLKVRTKSLFEELFSRKVARPVSYVREKHFHFDPRILTLGGDIYLDGNWNSYRYFEDIAALIRTEFTLRQTPTGRNSELLAKIDSVAAVSIHVRRGDYISNPKVNAIYGCCPLDYYRRAVDIVRERVPSPHFFIFSDDPLWVDNNLQIAAPMTLVDCNGPLEAHEDLRLMSRCRHNIIANSGFSWWGAWLNPAPDKMVIAPKQWFLSEKYDVRDLLPAEWVRV